MFKFSTQTNFKLLRRIQPFVRKRLLKRGLDPDNISCTRRGINWQLDIDEAIDFSIYAFGAFEKKTLKVLSKVIQKGETFIDVGANIGSVALPVAQLLGPKGQVIAIEPSDIAINRLQTNLSLNPSLCNNVELVHAFVSDKPDRTASSVYSSWKISGFNPFDRHPHHAGRLQPAEKAQTITLDEFTAARNLSPDWLKIDVDGHECEVLRGAIRLLQEERPKLLLEICNYTLESRGEDLHQLMEILWTAGYEVRNLNLKALPTGARWAQKLIPKMGATNILAFHHERPLPLAPAKINHALLEWDSVLDFTD